MKADRPLPDCVWCPQDRKVLSGLNPLRVLSPPPSSFLQQQCWGSLACVLGRCGAAKVFTAGCSRGLFHGSPGRGCREFVLLCDIQVRRIIAKQHFFTECFPSPLMLLCNIHCMDISSIMTIWEGCTAGVFRTLMASLCTFWSTARCCPVYVVWLRTVLCTSTVPFYIYCKITTDRNSGLCVYTTRVSNDPLYMTCKGTVSAKPLTKTIYLAKDRETFLQGGLPQFLSGNFG